MRNIIVFYHKDCRDGFAAAWAARKKLGNAADYIGIKASSSEQNFKGVSGKIVYFLDAAPDQPATVKNLRKTNKEVVLIDHHITREMTAPFYSGSLFSLNHSGAVLSWQYFHGKSPVPKLFLYIEDYDLWRFKLPFSRELNAAAELQEFDFKSWDTLVRDFENAKKREEFRKHGEGIIKYINKAVRGLTDGAELVNFEGHKVFALNAPSGLRNEAGNYLVSKRKTPFAIIWRYEGGKIHVSLRSGRSIDVSKVAERYGGGGHKRAASFLLDLGKTFPWRKIGS